jgi:hypothetical protein
VDEVTDEDVPAAPVLTARQVRARRRRRRRLIGTFVFLAVAVGILAAAYFVLVAPDDSSSDEAGPLSSIVTTTSAPRPNGPYRVTAGVNIRQGPGTNFPAVGNVETGRPVFVACVVDGQPVDAPTGPTTKWLKLTGFGPAGYLTAAYVDVGGDLDVPGKIPVCGA